eukprot:6209847-Pleurochrysis_carterae.AAC.1
MARQLLILCLTVRMKGRTDVPDQSATQPQVEVTRERESCRVGVDTWGGESGEERQRAAK